MAVSKYQTVQNVGRAAEITIKLLAVIYEHISNRLS